MSLTTKLIAAAGVLTLAAGVLVLPPAKVLAWHPEGKIVKYVTNETAGSEQADANTEAEAVSTKPGDILNYTITVRNDAQPAHNGHNDLAFVEITDELPAGVELVSDPSQRVIKDTIDGVIKPGESVTKTYKVRVVSETDGDLVKNTACFTGDSTVKDNKQQGCDDAYIKVRVEKEVPPTEEPKQPEVPAELPRTGLGAIVGTLAGIGTVSFAAVNYHRSRKAVADALKK